MRTSEFLPRPFALRMITEFLNGLRNNNASWR
jgi:hypothetical protein